LLTLPLHLLLPLFVLPFNLCGKFHIYKNYIKI
jgi:hypothetical protein